MKPIEAVVVTPIRIGLGALFMLAAYLKLSDPQAFAESVKAFKIFDLATASHLVTLATFTVPWVEMICGVLLVLGLWSRAASVALAGLLLAFTIGIISVLQREVDVRCGCFGKYEWPCTGNISMCHVARNSIMLLCSLLITLRGGGPVALDWFRRKRAPVDSEPQTA